SNAQLWQLLGLQSSYIYTLALHPVNPDTIYAGAGRLYRSTDGGLTWHTLYPGGCQDIAIHPYNPQIIYIVSGTVMKTIDGGHNWFPANSGINLNPEEFLWSIEINPILPHVLFAGSGGFYGGKLFRTLSAGNYWSQIGDTIPQLNNGTTEITSHPVDPFVAFVGTAWFGDVMKTMDSGDSWIATGIQLGIVEDIKIDHQNPNVVYAVGSSNGFKKSEDGGNSWNTYNAGLPPNVGLKAVVIDHHSEMLYLATQHSVYRSNIDTIQWEIFSSGLPSNVHPTTMVMDTFNSILYLGTEHGIYKTDVVTGTSVEGTTILPVNPHLYQNYPNPFNPTTTIKFQIPKSGFAILKIIVILGKEVATLLEKELPPGTYTVQWDGTNDAGIPVASGVYFYRLEVASQQGRTGNGFVQTRKMLLMR
ncbi:MAG: FlgD immunoglobulin-like domain containing protein, partial [Calditrichia bacterium]